MPPERPLLRGLGRAVVVTLVLLGLLIFRAPFFGLALRLWLVALAAIFVWALMARAQAGWTVSDGPARRLDWRSWRRPRQVERVRALEELEHAVEFSLGTAFDVHYRLRPHLVRIASHRLSLRGIDLEAQPLRARELVGDDAWELVRPDRPSPARRNARGIPLASLTRVVERLHAL